MFLNVIVCVVLTSKLVKMNETTSLIDLLMFISCSLVIFYIYVS